LLGVKLLLNILERDQYESKSLVKTVIACAAFLLALANSSLASNHTRRPNPADSGWNNQTLIEAATSVGENPTSADLLARRRETGVSLRLHCFAGQ
jgi:hypothetical protein